MREEFYEIIQNIGTISGYLASDFVRCRLDGSEFVQGDNVGGDYSVVLAIGYWNIFQ